MENLDQSNNKNVSLSLIAEYGSESDSEDTRSNDHTGNEDSDAIELSEMVLKNNIINACAHGPLSDSSENDVGSTRHMIIDSSESGVVEYDVTEYRDIDSDSDSSSDDSSDSDVDSVKDIEELSSGDEQDGNNRSGKIEIPKVHGELGLDDLPPIEDLAISLPAQETIKIGKIANIVDRLVIVRAFEATPAVDLDSILFLENGAKALGKVFDVFGPVTEPHYCVRFNSLEHVRARGVSPGMDVFIAPRSSHTSYVFLSELMKVKGSDASWLNDIEPPPNHVDYSDDEEERRANKAKKEQQKQNKQESSEDGETSKNPPARKILEAKRHQRPSEFSSRFGGSSRGRSSVPPGFRRNPSSFVRNSRPWDDQEMRTPPPHPAIDPGGQPFFPPTFSPMFAPFNLASQPFMMNRHPFGRMPRMQGPMNMPPPFRQNVPVFGSNYCNMSGAQPQWRHGPPPPPGT